jgi:hypothetical protein
MQNRSMLYFAVVVLIGIAIVGGTLFFFEKRGSPIVGSWEMRGDYAQRLLMEFKPDGTGSTSFASSMHATERGVFKWSVSDTTLYVYDAERGGTGDKKYELSFSNDHKTLYLHAVNPMASDMTLVLSAVP